MLVQRELGQRLAAKVGDELYGGLSALMQSLFDVRSLRDVSPSVFRPRPKVWSSIIRLERRADASDALQPADARRRFARFVRRLFGQRRKTLRTTAAAAAEELGLTPQPLPEDLAPRRAEELAPDQLVGLWQACERY